MVLLHSSLFSIKISYLKSCISTFHTHTPPHPPQTVKNRFAKYFLNQPQNAQKFCKFVVRIRCCFQHAGTLLFKMISSN